jgi:predicted ATPase
VLELPFVGRRSELRLFHEALAALAAGRSSVVVVTGEQGSGKTRLLDELSRRASAQGAVVALDLGMSFAPFNGS